MICRPHSTFTTQDLLWAMPNCRASPVEAYFITIRPMGRVERVALADLEDVEGLHQYTVKKLQPGRPVSFSIQAINTYAHVHMCCPRCGGSPLTK